MEKARSILSTFLGGLLVFLFSMFELAVAQENSFENSRQNVILITIDGVRWKDVLGKPDPKIDGFDQADIMPYMKNVLLKQGTFLGQRSAGNQMITGNIAQVSLPGYFNLLGGKSHSCVHNYCGRIKTQTLAERVLMEFGLPKHKVAVISSWEKIEWAAQFVEESVFTNSGLAPLLDGTNDPELEALNQAQTSLTSDARLDFFTFKQSLRYLKVHRPRFMYLSFNDPDEWAHRDSYKSYVYSLRAIDNYLRDLLHELREMGEYGQNTTILVTTDHGRGEGIKWPHHSQLVKGSEEIWLFALGPQIARKGIVPQFKVRSQLDIRPTLEYLLGLGPISCQGCGQVMEELLR